jgi:hypothetical protein
LERRDWWSAGEREERRGLRGSEERSDGAGVHVGRCARHVSGEAVRLVPYR